MGKTQKSTNSDMSWSTWLNKTKPNHMLKELSEEPHETTLHRQGHGCRPGLELTSDNRDRGFIIAYWFWG